MSLPSKEENVAKLFFNEPSKQWHFEEILQASKVSRAKANKWLKKLVKENIIKRIKPRTKMPFFQANFEHPNYRTTKKLYALSQLKDSGFLGHLIELPKAKTVILFGSFSRADWYSGSDIDLFIYGDDDGLNIGKFRPLLKREIQVFAAKDFRDLRKYGQPLLRNILEGNLIKGKLDFVEVKPLATV